MALGPEHRLILASKSASRAAVLKAAGLQFEQIGSGVDEDSLKAGLRAEGASVAKQADLLAETKALKVSIEGHTDNIGDKKANQTLSQKRAEAVMKVIASKGIDAKRLKAAGRGDSIPVADNRIEEGRALNRRVELVKF